MHDNRRFGAKKDVEPVSFLISAAAGWGGNPREVAIYTGGVPAKNDGKVVHKLTLKDVPVDGFWSISLYNGAGYFEENSLKAYSINNVSAAKNKDGSTTIQFGGCDGTVSNCLPIMAQWNHVIRLYRPRKEILNGTWKAPSPAPVE